MPKWCKTVIAVLLLPVCFGAGKALWQVLSHSGNASTIWVGLFAGVACWMVIYALLPKPMWVYVMGHELTHVLWTWLFGWKVKKMKVSSKGGHVAVTNSNFLTALAPYFFPLYAAIVVLVYFVGHFIWKWEQYAVVFHLLLGAAYAFHVTLTWDTLKIEQSDITSQGYLFSAVVIFLGNVGLLVIGLPLLTAEVNPLEALGWWFGGIGDALRFMGGLFPRHGA